eukprot:COSAG04_NODE_399_length_14959_cov_28.238730_12_plen_33_part_00
MQFILYSSFSISNTAMFFKSEKISLMSSGGMR